MLVPNFRIFWKTPCEITRLEKKIELSMQISRSDRRMLIWFLLALIIALLPWIVLAQESHIERINVEPTYGYTQMVRVGNTLYLSGVTGKGPINESIESVYKWIEIQLKQAGADFSHVVKENLYTTDLDAVKKNNAVRLKFYNGAYPAATWVQVDRLFQPEYNLEVEVIAVINP